MSQSKKRRWIRWVVFSVFALPVLLFGASLLGFFPWSSINCSHRDVDINSGRVRFTRYIFWLPVSETVEDSALTRALLPEDLAAIPEWHHAVTLSPGLRNSPHYIFHSAISQIQELEIIWRLSEFTPAARRASARRVLELWQQSGRDDDAKPYLRALGELTDDHGTIDEGDLPKQ